MFRKLRALFRVLVDEQPSFREMFQSQKPSNIIRNEEGFVSGGVTFRAEGSRINQDGCHLTFAATRVHFWIRHTEDNGRHWYHIAIPYGNLKERANNILFEYDYLDDVAQYYYDADQFDKGMTTENFPPGVKNA
jgi:hypothetical protein